MAYKCKILKQASVEYREIVGYLARVLCAPDAALDFIEEFNKQIKLVCESPEMYGLSHVYELAVLGYRAILVKNYVALYKIQNDTVVVAHIFHQSQNYAKLI